MTLFNNTGQHSNFTQAPGSTNHLLLMAHQARTGWFRGKHQGCHQQGPLPSVTVSLWSSACDHLSHPHTLTCKSVTATGGHSTIHYFQLLEGSPCSGAGGTAHVHSRLARTVPRSQDLPRCPQAPTPEEHRATMDWLLLPVQRWHKGDALAMPQH